MDKFHKFIEFDFLSDYDLDNHLAKLGFNLG